MQSHCRSTTLLVALVLIAFAVNSTAPAKAATANYESDLIARTEMVFGTANMAAGTGPTIKCGTPLAYEIRMAWPNLSASARERLTGIVDLQARPVLDEFYDKDTPQGNFRIHYTRTGTHAVDMSFGVGEGNVPVYVLKCAAYLDTVVEREMVDMGFRFPVSDQIPNAQEDPRYDIYFQNLGPGFYGVTIAETVFRPSGSNVSLATSYLELNNDYSRLFGYANRPFEAMAVTIAHELNHAVQWSYDAFEAEIRVPQGGSDPMLFPWFFEITSTYLEDMVFDYVNDYLLYLPAFFNNPWLSLRRFESGSTVEALHCYAASIWGHMLRERHDELVMREIWDQCGADPGFNTFDAMETVLATRGSSFAEEYAEFLVWNYFTGDRAEDWSYSEGAEFDYLSGFGGKIPDSLIATFENYPFDTVTIPVVKGTKVRTPHHSDEFGATYMRFIPPPTSEDVPDLNLTITPVDFSECMVVTAGLRSGLPPEVNYTLDIFHPVVVSDWSRFDEVLVVVSPYNSEPDEDFLALNLGFEVTVEDSVSSGTGQSSIAKVYSNPLVVGSAGADAPFQIDVTLAEPAEVSMHIFSTDGGLVAGGKEDDMQVSPGPRSVKLRWSGMTRGNQPVVSGIYLALVQIGDKKEVVKVAVKNTQ